MRFERWDGRNGALSFACGRVFLCVALCVFSLLSAVEAKASVDDILREESRVVLNEVPSIPVRLTDGRELELAELWSERPVIVTLFYQRCAGACSPFLCSFKEAVDRVGGLGEYYDIVALSFDPQDDLDRVEMLAEDIGFASYRGWHRGVSTAEGVDALMASIGFWFEPVEGTNQFDHPSLIAAVRDGRVVRVLLGNMVMVPRYRELVMELRGTYVPFYTNPGQDTVFRCVAYDPQSGALTLGWGLLMLLLPACLAWVATLLLFSSKRRRGTLES